MEFIHRKKKITNLKVGDKLMNYPIVSQYKYLGSWLNQKLTVNSQLEHIIKKTNYIRHRLTPTLYNSSLDFRKNLWQVFILPLYEFTLPIYYHEETKSGKTRVELSLRKSFKSFTGLKKTVNTELVENLMAYNAQERSQILFRLSEQKWEYRQKGEYYDPKQDPSLILPESQPNLCKNQPKNMIKYINMQTALCPVCKNNINDSSIPFKARCSLSHLEKVHNLHLEPVGVIAKKVLLLTELQKHKKKKDTGKMTRSQIVKYAETLIEPNLNRLRAFLNE